METIGPRHLVQADIGLCHQPGPPHGIYINLNSLDDLVLHMSHVQAVQFSPCDCHSILKSLLSN